MKNLDLYEVGEQLGFAYGTIYKWVRTGRIKGVRYGRVWRVSQAEVDRLFAEGVMAESVAPDGSV